MNLAHRIGYSGRAGWLSLLHLPAFATSVDCRDQPEDAPMLFRTVAAALILLFGGATALARTVNVSVGGYTSGGDYGGYGGSDTPVLMFNPANVTIDVGDSVTFTNLGGVSVPHNVHADDNSFRCANGCDGGGGDGTPAANQWTATVTFTKAGIVDYHCDIHQSMGMTGRITVNAVAAAGQNITGGISGNWFNPTANQGGHGFQIEVLPNNGMLAIWFVFNPAGNAQNWIYAQGSYDPASNVATLPAFLEQGGAFPPNFDSGKLTAPAWGSLKFSFSDCNNGTVDWTSNATSLAAGYADTTFPIQRLTSLAGTTCP
jgi:plastocyanin